MAGMGGFIDKGIQIDGGTDNTTIGNISDRLKVTSTEAYTGSAVRLLDMNASNGGVARDTGITSTSVYTQLFSYSGTGYLYSFLVTLEGNLIGADSFVVKFEIDGTTVLDLSTVDVGTAALYNLNSTGDEFSMGVCMLGNSFRYTCPKGGSLRFSSSVKVSVRKDTSTASKRFRAGLVHLAVSL